MAVHVIPGYLEDESLLLSELAVFYGIVVMANEICKEHQIADGEMDATMSKPQEEQLT